MECLLYENNFVTNDTDLISVYFITMALFCCCRATVRILLNSDRIYSVVYIETVKLCVNFT